MCYLFFKGLTVPVPFPKKKGYKRPTDVAHAAVLTDVRYRERAVSEWGRGER